MTRAATAQLPFVLQPLNDEHVLAVLPSFVDQAMRGVGMGDQTIINAWTETCTRLPAARVRIWSFDQDLACYDRLP